MKIVIALPGRMRFEAGSAGSIELCVSEWVSGSRYRDSITILAEPGGAPVSDVSVHRRAPVKRFVSLDIANSIRKLSAERGCDLIITQQHIATAARIAMFNSNIPVILQTHNHIDPPVAGVMGSLKNRWKRLEFARLAGMTLVSEDTLRRFELDWPEVSIPRRVIPNAADFSGWSPAADRQKLVLVVGRAHDTKGILEAAQGTCSFLRDFPDWRATFLLSATALHPEYFTAVVDALKPCQEQVDVRTDVPFAEVKKWTEAAAICVVPAKWAEPFGRAALEAHSGGAALISSGTGGLREISGEAALYLSEIDGLQIHAALSKLARDSDLRERLARDGMERVRRRFRLTGDLEHGEPFPSVCQRLDDFMEQVLGSSRSAHRNIANR